MAPLAGAIPLVWGLGLVFRRDGYGRFLSGRGADGARTGSAYFGGGFGAAVAPFLGRVFSDGNRERRDGIAVDRIARPA